MQVWSPAIMNFKVIAVLTCAMVVWAHAEDLTAPEQDAVTHLIKDILAPNLGDHGVKIFLKIFEARPDYQQLFTKFADVPKDELAKSDVMRNHAINILLKFAKCVMENLENEMYMSACFMSVANDHKPMNIGHSHAKDLTAVLDAYLGEALQDAYSGDLHSGMAKIFKVIEDAFLQAQ